MPSVNDERNDGTNTRRTGEQIPEGASGVGSIAERTTPILLDGIHQLVTPCHAFREGLRASKICRTCGGDLDEPVETAQALVCGHWTTVMHTQGDRKITCSVCGAESIVRAERVLVTRYFSYTANVETEQFNLFE